MPKFLDSPIWFDKNEQESEGYDKAGTAGKLLMSNGTRKPEWKDPSEITVGEAGSAGYATRAGYATSAGSAGSATNAVNANYASTAGYAERAGSAIFPQNFVAVMYGNNPPESTGWTSITWTGIPSGCTAWVKGTIPTKYIEFISETADGVAWQGSNPVYVPEDSYVYPEFVTVQSYSPYTPMDYVKIESNRSDVRLNGNAFWIMKGQNNILQKLDISWNTTTVFPIIITPRRLETGVQIYGASVRDGRIILRDPWQRSDIEDISINDFGLNLFTAGTVTGSGRSVEWNTSVAQNRPYYIEISAYLPDETITGYAVIDLS